MTPVKKVKSLEVPHLDHQLTVYIMMLLMLTHIFKIVKLRRKTIVQKRPFLQLLGLLLVPSLIFIHLADFISDKNQPTLQRFFNFYCSDKNGYL